MRSGLSRELARSQDRLARLTRRAAQEGASSALAEAVEELGHTLVHYGVGDVVVGFGVREGRR